MRSAVFSIIIASAVLFVAACRQPDGPTPTPETGVQEELRDVARDLQNVAARRPEAEQELADDVRKYIEDEDASVHPVVDELLRMTTEALPDGSLSEQAAQQLAHTLWISITARELSERQVESIQNDLQALLMSTGIAEEKAMQVATQAGEVQRTVTNRQRRWYEVF